MAPVNVMQPLVPGHAPNDGELSVPGLIHRSHQDATRTEADRFALPEEWEQHRENIRQLYVTENRTLKDVMETMKRVYGHVGCLKMYKSRLTKWGFDTKYKKRGANQPAEPSTKRRTAAIEPRITESQPTGHRDADLALVRSPRCPPDCSGGCGSPSCTVSDIFCQVPTSTKTPSSVSTTSRHKTKIYVRQRQHRDKISRMVTLQDSACIPEQIISLVNIYISSSFVNGLWELDYDGVCISTLSTPEDMGEPESFYDSFRSAIVLFDQGSAAEGGQVVRKAFDMVKKMIETGNVRALHFIWNSLVYLVQLRRVEIATILVKHVKAMAETILHPAHPLIRIFELPSQALIWNPSYTKSGNAPQTLSGLV